MGPVTDTHRLTYYENFQLALQEKKAQFDDAFMYTSSVTGKQVQVVDLIGTTTARLDAPEGGDTPDIDQQHEPVWMRPRRIDWGKIIKEEDRIKALTDFKSPYVQSGVNAITRQKNVLLAGGLFGPRLIGNEVPVSTPWAGRTVAEDVGGTGATGMNVKKILRGINYMETDEIVIEEEQLFLVLDPQEIEDLYSDLTFISKDYREKAQLDDINRRVTAIFGIPIIPSKRLTNSDSDTSVAALFARSGMWWGPAMPLRVQSQPNPSKQYREHPYAEMWLAVTRSEDAKVVKILNKF
jgi:hypothetical protein